MSPWVYVAWVYVAKLCRGGGRALWSARSWRYQEQVLYTGWSLVFSEDDFTVRQFNLATANCNQIDTRLAMH